MKTNNLKLKVNHIRMRTNKLGLKINYLRMTVIKMNPQKQNIILDRIIQIIIIIVQNIHSNYNNKK